MGTVQPILQSDTARFLACIADELQSVEQRLEVGLESRSRLTREAVHYILTSKGKRIRPALLLLTAKLCGYQAGTRHIKLAVAAEYMHAATLIHDDIIDRAETRRGRPAVHVQWGTQISVLIGDFLYAQAIQTLIRDGDLRVLEAFSEATIRMSEGEVMELEAAKNLELRPEDYLTIATFKTAVLLSAACRAGGLIGQAPEQATDALAAFGLNLGIGFQLIDDTLDFTGQSETLGKPVGQDIKEGKITLPLIHAVQHGTVDTQLALRRLFAQEALSDPDCAEVAALVIRSHGVTATLDKARGFLETAKACLEPFPPSAAKDALCDITEFVQTRTR
jgi:octaprenyl-diphosphate synthase